MLYRCLRCGDARERDDPDDLPSWSERCSSHEWESSDYLALDPDARTATDAANRVRGGAIIRSVRAIPGLIAAARAVVDYGRVWDDRFKTTTVEDLCAARRDMIEKARAALAAIEDSGGGPPGE